MRFVFYILISVLFWGSCKNESQKVQEVIVDPEYITQEADSICRKDISQETQEVIDSTLFTIGYADDGAILHSYRITEITEEEFLKHDTAYTKLIKEEIRQTDSLFFLTIEGKDIPFKKETNFDYGINRAGESWYEYVGYFPDLGMYGILDVSVSQDLHGFSDFLFIDKNSRYKYRLLPMGDGFEDAPLLSPLNKYMVYFYNDVFSTNDVSYLRILKINDRNIPTIYMVRHSEIDNLDFFIESLNWVTDNILIAKVFKEEVENIIYEYRKIIIEE